MATSSFPRRTTKYSTATIAAHGEIQTISDTIQASKLLAKSPASMNATSTPEASTPAASETFQRATRTPNVSAASPHE